jgi:hypothetical protein
MPSEDGIHCKEKNKMLLIRTMDSGLRRNDFLVLVMPFVIPVKTGNGIHVMPL